MPCFRPEGGRSRHVRPCLQRCTNRFRSVQTLTLGACHDRCKFLRGQANWNYLRSGRTSGSTAPSGSQLVHIVAGLGLRDPLVDLCFVDFLALDRSLHELIVIRRECAPGLPWRRYATTLRADVGHAAGGIQSAGPDGGPARSSNSARRSMMPGIRPVAAAQTIASSTSPYSCAITLRMPMMRSRAGT